MKDRLDVLDGLRGIAVLLVLWYHVWEISWQPVAISALQFIPETGFIGVHLFFFLSGFVITYPFLRAQVADKAAPTWGHFYWRRFIKIVPSYLLSIAVAYAIGYAATQTRGEAVWQDLVSHLLFVHTWWPDTYGGINGVLWTLAVEVEFYCIFPLVWWCFSRRPWITAGAMIAISLAYRHFAAHCCYTNGFALLEDNLPGFLDIFACGMLSALVFTRYGHAVRESRLRWAMPLVALAAIAVLAALLQNLFGYRLADQWSAVWQIDKRTALGVCFAVIATASLASPRAWQVLFANRPLRFLALISYNLYLYHQMIAREMLAWHLPPYLGDPHYNPIWQTEYLVLTFALTIGQAALVTYLFERPILRFEPRPIRQLSGHSPTM